MPIDLRSEEVISLAEAARHLPRRSNGKRINVATIHRWASLGCKGVCASWLTAGVACFKSVRESR